MMTMPSRAAVLLTPVLLAGCGLLDDDGCLSPLVSLVRLRPFEIDTIDNWNDPKPVIQMMTVREYAPCWSLALSWSRGRQGALHCRILGVDSSETEYSCNMPAMGALPLPQIPFEYDATISYDEFTDRYRVHIDDTLIRLTPLEQHFTILHDSVWHRFP